MHSIEAQLHFLQSLSAADLVASTIAIAALATAVYSNYLTRRDHIRSHSVHLDINRQAFVSTNPGRMIGIDLQNFGPGVASIFAIELSYKDWRGSCHEWQEMVGTRAFENHDDAVRKIGLKFFEGGPYGVTYLSPGEKMELVWFDFLAIYYELTSASDDELERLVTVLNEAMLLVTYASIWDGKRREVEL